ncbi:hypothetical protein HNP24_001131 [Chryseobacterium sediminis]|uniref:Uncharacterized protein n=1 Tax=Chryseobacterium sediminis TaxID=1679494 RepID=A0ABR6PXI9_9FLAO|nr:hypothetical protein [Chryseobacterium sediminis]
MMNERFRFLTYFILLKSTFKYKKQKSAESNSALFYISL